MARSINVFWSEAAEHKTEQTNQLDYVSAAHIVRDPRPHLAVVGQMDLHGGLKSRNIKETTSRVS